MITRYWYKLVSHVLSWASDFLFWLAVVLGKVSDRIDQLSDDYWAKS